MPHICLLLMYVRLLADTDTPQSYCPAQQSTIFTDNEGEDLVMRQAGADL